MATINYFLWGQKRELVPIFVRFSAGRGTDLMVKSGLLVDPKTWSSKTQTIKQRIRTKEDEELVNRLEGLHEFIKNEAKLNTKEFNKDWLKSVIHRYHNNKGDGSATLNGYIEKVIADGKAGVVKNEKGRNLSPETIKGLKVFQRIFNEYQGVYTEKRVKKLTEDGKTLRPRITIDFNDITIDFYKSFTNFLSDEGFKLNTQGKLLKHLKYFMSKALTEKKHGNREFTEAAFGGLSEDTFAIYLTPEEIEKIYKKDLSSDKRMEIARDKFIVLCETALRVSDYDKIDLNIRTIEGKPFIALYQTKTADPVIIPLTVRMKSILDKYNGHLPHIPEQYVNRYIKTVAQWCGIDEVIRWETTTYGKRHPKSAHKWELITCHSGRRSAATNMYRAGIKTIDIMRITGHHSEKTFMRYIRITNEDAALDISKHDYFNTPLRVAK
jgi:integrase